MKEILLVSLIYYDVVFSNKGVVNAFDIYRVIFLG